MSELRNRLHGGLPDSFIRDLDKPTLHGLSYALRHPETWPEGFFWNFGECDKCAMGLAHELWPEIVPEANKEDGASIMARSFAMNLTQARNIFMGNSYDVPSKRMLFGLLSSSEADWSVVTPDMVADAIDKYTETAR